MNYFTTILKVKLVHVLNIILSSGIISLKYGVVFVTGGIISIKCWIVFITGRYGTIKNILRYGSILSINPLLFLLEKREPTADETDTIVQIIEFINMGFRQGLSEDLIIQLARDTAEWDLTHEGMVYLVRLGIDLRMITMDDVPLGLLPLQTGDDVVEVSFDIYQFIIDNSIIIVSCVALGFISVIVYLFRPKHPVPPMPGVDMGGSNNHEDPIDVNTENTSREVIRESPLKYKSLWKYAVTLYASYILFIRSFFIKEKPWFIPLLVIIAHLNLYLKVLPSYEIVSITKFFLWLGIYCIAIDGLGSLISTYALKGTSDIFDQVIPFLTDARENPVSNFYKSAGFSALFIGKTAMTATGRASLFIGVASGTGYLVNAHLDRRHQAVQNDKNRESAREEGQRQRDEASREAQRQREWASNEAQKQRDWQDQKDRQKMYDSSWNLFKKPPKQTIIEKQNTKDTNTFKP